MKKELKKTMISLIGLSAIIILFSSGKYPDLKSDFVKINDTLFAGKYEVSNKEYRMFLKDLINTGQTEKYNKCIYDSTQYEKKFPLAHNEPFKNLYHSHPAYDYYPVVNISKYGAESYCEWLTEKNKEILKQSFKKYREVKFCLPTELQWRKIASPLVGHNLPWYGNYAYENDKDHTILANIKMRDYVRGCDDYISDGGIITNIRGYYKPNKYGIYDIIGNAAEMTSTGVVKGGSWFDYIDDCSIEKNQDYQTPDPRVGFRVIIIAKK